MLPLHYSPVIPLTLHPTGQYCKKIRGQLTILGATSTKPEKGEFRLITHHVLTANKKTGSPEAVLTEVNAMPEPAEIEKTFDFKAEYHKYIEEMDRWQKLVEPMLWLHSDFNLNFDKIASGFFYKIFIYKELGCLLALIRTHVFTKKS